jgi:hypothetical protein
VLKFSEKTSEVYVHWIGTGALQMFQIMKNDEQIYLNLKTFEHRSNIGINDKIWQSS